MFDSPIEQFRRRRAARLAARHLKPKQYRRSEGMIKVSKKELLKGLKRFDAPDGDDQPEQQQNQEPKPVETGGSHGNTRLPFGLCKRFGIEIGKDWTPRDAWAALAGKGITADIAYRRLKEGKDPGVPEKDVETPAEPEKPAEPEPPKEPKRSYTDDRSGKEVEELDTEYRSWSRYSPYIVKGYYKDDAGEKQPTSRRFETKLDMMYFLKQRGTEEVMDPETGEIVNPQEIEFPEVMFMPHSWDFRYYTNPSIGLRGGRYAVVGEGLDGKKKKLEDFTTLAGAKDWLVRKGVPEDKIKMTSKMKKREAERVAWLSSDKKEWIEEDGIRFGDLAATRDGDSFWSKGYYIVGSDEEGKKHYWKFRTKIEMMSFLKSEGVERCKVDGEFVNPQEFEVPEVLAHVQGTDYQSFRWGTDSQNRVILYGTDLNGDEYVISSPAKDGKFESYRELLLDLPGMSEEVLDKANGFDDVQDAIKEWDLRAERAKKFDEEAVMYHGRRIMDPVIEPVTGTPYFMLKGYDRDGEKIEVSSLYTYSHLPKLFDRIEKDGLSPENMLGTLDVEEAYNNYKSLKGKFETEAVEIGGERYLNPEITLEDGKFCVYGFTKFLERKAITAESSSIGDIVEMLDGFGVDAKSLIQEFEVEDAYNEYQKFKAEFDEKSTDFDGVRYGDLQIMTREDSSGIEFILCGKNIKGRIKSVKSTQDLNEFKKYLSDHGVDIDSIPFYDEESKKDYDRKVKEMEAVDSGDYFDYEHRAFRDFKIRKSGRYFTALATDIDGVEKDVCTLDSLDDVMDDLERWGVNDYKIMKDGEWVSRPTDGMRKVRMMRTRDGEYVITATFGKDQSGKVYTSNSEEEARTWLRDNGIDEKGITVKGMNPNDDVPRVHTARTLRDFDQHRSDYEDEYKLLKRMSMDQKQEAVDMMTEMFKKGAYRMRRSGHFREIVLGHFMNTLESKTSGGCPGDHTRRTTEEITFGCSGHEDIEGEKYGYLGLEDDEEEIQSDLAGHYGRIIYKFKKSAVENRTTYTLGDTLDSSPESSLSRPLAGYAGPNPTYEGISALRAAYLNPVMNLYRSYKKGEIDFKELLKEISNKCRDDYIEVQYHDMLTIDDVESVCMREVKFHSIMKDMTKEEQIQVIHRLKEAGVEMKIWVGYWKDGYDIARLEYGVE
ncbi:MAG: hypothetical protein II659_07950 [Bacteroidales bacterium]|nr:hypothetical protein [Bacteroidales bacterium]